MLARLSGGNGFAGNFKIPLNFEKTIGSLQQQKPLNFGIINKITVKFRKFQKKKS